MKDFDLIKRDISLKIRNFTNLATGQQELIEKYNAASYDLCVAIDNEKDPERKKQLQTAHAKITEEYWKSEYNKTEN